ncbi:MAG: leucine-rich repeat domain-containing protein [Treponema sp.]|jgi:hypothetical protein|nr:leucine-rich repeat domain-containing protein [Treponema sp.]
MKKTKLCMAGMLAAALILSMAFAACGPRANPAKDFKRKANDQGGITITGYVGQSQTVVIPGKLDGKPVTEIGGQAFGSGGGHPSLTSVIIPNSVTKIEWYAFYSNLLASVTIGNSVTEIGPGAFFANQLTSVTIPDSVIAIGEDAFSGNQLTSVTIGNSVTSLDGFAHNQLTSVTIPDSVTEIRKGAFSNNQLTSITIGSNVSIASTVAHTRDRWGYTITEGVEGSFGSRSFENLYNNGGKQAGTYTRPDTDSADWTRQ